MTSLDIKIRPKGRTVLRHGADVPRPRKEPNATLYSGRMAKRLREFREAAGITPAELAEKLTRAGYRAAASTLYAWENGNLQVQVDAVPVLAKIFRVSIREFFPEK